MLEIWGCSLSTSAAYTQVFTVIFVIIIKFLNQGKNDLKRTMKTICCLTFTNTSTCSNTAKIAFAFNLLMIKLNELIKKNKQDMHQQLLW